MNKDFSELQDILQDFQNHVVIPNWLAAWEDEDLFESTMDIIQAITEGTALLDIQESIKKNIIAQLVIGSVHIAHAYGHDELYQEYQNATQMIEKALHELLEQKSWVTAAQNRFGEFIKYQETLEQEDQETLSAEKTDYLRPVFLAFAVATLASLPHDYEEEDNDKCCDDDAD